ncbi:hypothetical protein EVAR_102092_1 [Eumeta japonica]|uniref:Uncharacterized protein n=1 Tax=Eumeta variegata TaxID=151549 RepID=A0A4C1U0G2_EUMVA|nr:hypothetical protein EVAR_102092_1 [Eumeta japonica]
MKRGNPSGRRPTGHFTRGADPAPRVRGVHLSPAGVELFDPSVWQWPLDRFNLRGSYALIMSHVHVTNSLLSNELVMNEKYFHSLPITESHHRTARYTFTLDPIASGRRSTTFRAACFQSTERTYIDGAFPHDIQAFAIHRQSSAWPVSERRSLMSCKVIRRVQYSKYAPE